MSYDIGTSIDLRYLNQKEVATAVSKSTQTEIQSYEVGTKYTFQFTNGMFKAFRQIPISFA